MSKNNNTNNKKIELEKIVDVEKTKAEIKKNQKKMKDMMSDFSKFATKGNVIDLAVGVVIGNAFSKIVTSLVNDLIMPLISVVTGEINLAKLDLVLVEASTNPDGTTKAGITLSYGNFLQTIVEFLIIAFSIFLALRYLEKLHKKIDELTSLKKKEEEKKEEKKEEIKKATTEDLLEEIRDLLKEQNKIKNK